ncbi:hypothetical protein [Streptomyces sp. Inha503]|uniref:hypothetical protein n=1 Tax=Streptomyces sp. Inha503 TaxID=3383314 RepID=UPI0039A06533
MSSNLRSARGVVVLWSCAASGRAAHLGRIAVDVAVMLADGYRRPDQRSRPQATHKHGFGFHPILCFLDS